MCSVVSSAKPLGQRLSQLYKAARSPLYVHRCQVILKKCSIFLSKSLQNNQCVERAGWYFTAVLTYTRLRQARLAASESGVQVLGASEKTRGAEILGGKRNRIFKSRNRTNSCILRTEVHHSTWS